MMKRVWIAFTVFSLLCASLTACTGAVEETGDTFPKASYNLASGVAYEATTDSVARYAATSADTVRAVAENGTTGVTVTWNSLSSAKGYRVYRSQYLKGKWSGYTRLRDVDGTAYTDTSAKSGATYRYAVRGKVGNQLSKYTASKAVKYLATPTVTIANAHTGVTIKWNRVAGVTNGYWIYRRELVNGKWSKWSRIKGRSAGKSDWTDTGAKSGRYYRYTVRAADGNTLSAFKASAGLRCLATPKVTIANVSTGIIVKWNKVAGVTNGYWIYRKELVEGKWSKWSRIKGRSAGKSNWTDTAVRDGVQYRYTVRAADGKFLSAYIASATLLHGGGGVTTTRPTTTRTTTTTKPTITTKPTTTTSPTTVTTTPTTVTTTPTTKPTTSMTTTEKPTTTTTEPTTTTTKKPTTTTTANPNFPKAGDTPHKYLKLGTVTINGAESSMVVYNVTKGFESEQTSYLEYECFDASGVSLGKLNVYIGRIDAGEYETCSFALPADTAKMTFVKFHGSFWTNGFV